MISIFPELHAGHAPAIEFYRGERVECFESPARAQMVRDELAKRGHDIIGPDADCRNVLKQIHSPRYLAFLEWAWSQWVARDPSNAEVQPFPAVWPIRTLRDDIEPEDFIARLGLYSMDTGSPMVAGTWAAAKAAADAAFSAANRVAAGERGVFCVSRPPGHHAGRDFMGGYCFLNNAAVAAQSLRNAGCERVAILDVDYHHGNGTQSIFYERADVLMVSLHGDPRTEYPFYLGHADEIGMGQGMGLNLNLPLAAGTNTADWFAALAVGIEKITKFGADALVVSLGLDTFANDPISKFALLSDDFLALGETLKRIGLPTVFILEGGYATQELGINAVNVIDGFENA